MANNTSEIFGQIGAAKIFAGSISNVINNQTTNNQETIESLKKQRDATSDIKEQKKLDKKIKRLSSQNNIVSNANSAVSGATDFLIDILKYCDIGKNQTISWIAEMLTHVLPSLEYSVKAVLLSDIKKKISCAMDPRIPDEWRTNGVLVNEKEIDVRNTLYKSPFSKLGKYVYFGIDSGDTSYSLSRAEDMDAFIWYAKNGTRFANANVIAPNKLSDYFNVDDNATLYNLPNNIASGKTGYNYLPGSIFKQASNANTVFLCVDRIPTSSEPNYEIIPVTSKSYNSINWYKATKKVEVPLFNLEYISSYNSSAKLPRNNFRFKILPKPFQMAAGVVTDLGNDITVLEEKVDEGVEYIVAGSATTKTSWSNMKWPGVKSLTPIVARFNKNGEYDKRGMYSIDENDYTISQESCGLSGITCFSLISKETGVQSYIIYDGTVKKFYLSSVTPTTELPHGTSLDVNQYSQILTECYFGKTVYEFNYDYVMSFKLFDAKEVSAAIINGLLNTNFKSFNAEDTSSEEITNTEQIYIDNYVDSLVDKIISNEDKEYTDCFYTFSNDDYIALEKKTNTVFANGSYTSSQEENVNEVYSILDAYSADSSLEEQTKCITQAITKASETSLDGDGAGESSDAGNNISESNGSDDSVSNFINRAVKLLTTQIVNSLLTPKLLMLIFVNKKLMETDIFDAENNYSFSYKDILGALEGTISALIKEVIDTIQKELLRVILAAIGKITSSYLKQLSIEYAKKWVDILKQLLLCFKINRSSVSSSNNGTNTISNNTIDNILNQVDYADIDSLMDQIVPNTNNC